MNNKLVSYFRIGKLFLYLFFLTNCIASNAQTTYSCDGAAPFIYGPGNCGTSISIAASMGGTQYSWYIGTDPNYLNNPVVSSVSSDCIPVTTPNILYYITLVIDDPSNGIFNFVSTCSYFVPKGLYSLGISPSALIDKTVNEKLPVGTIKGINSVSLTGAATYDIPIAIPKGSVGVEPSLSISYSSQGGNGLLGMGWNLFIGSGISRTNKDYYNDSYPSAPIGADADAYALDGNRLVLLSGKYGEDGSVYGTKSETFSRITLHVPYTTQTGVDEYGNTFPYNVNGDSYFIVETKNGMTMEYGYAKDAIIGSTIGSTGTDIAAWLLNKATDPNGNYMEYKYAKRGTEVVLKEVNYTGNEKNKIAPYNKIIFDYSDRFDKNISYPISNGSSGVVDAKSLLLSITILAEGGNLYRKYEFTYVFDDIHSYLRQLQVAGSDGVFLNPTEFKYGNIDKEFEGLGINYLAYLPQKPVKIAGDFNGDGINDLIEQGYDPNTQRYTSFKSVLGTKAGNTFTPVQTTSIDYEEPTVFGKNSAMYSQINFLAQDFNGDGFDDVPFASFAPPTYYTSAVRELKSIDIFHSDGTGKFSAVKPNATNSKYRYTVLGATLNLNYIVTGDFDGDSQADYLTILSDKTEHKLFANFPGTNSLNNEVKIVSFLPNPGGIKYPYIGGKLAKALMLRSIDIDGDGKNEIFYLAQSEKNPQMNDIIILGITFNTVSKEYEAKAVLYYSIASEEGNIQFADFNGDRKTDMLTAKKVDNKYAITQYLSTGQSSFVKTGNFIHNIYNGLGDFNGDGLSDIYFVNRSDVDQNNVAKYTISVQYSTGTGFAPLKTYQYPSPVPMSGLGLVYSDVIGDFNGDGKTDIFKDSRILATFFPNSTNHLLELVVDGYNRTVSFTYSNATDNAIFGKGAAKTYPLNSVQLPMFLAETMNEPDGVGGTSSTYYRYNNAVLHRRGIGFMGFGYIKSENSITGIITENSFIIKDNLISSNNKTNYSTQLENTKVSKANGQISETDYVNNVEDQGNGRIWFNTKSTTSTDYITGAISNKTYGYDTFGNTTSERVEIAGVQTVTTSAVYAKHGSWIASSPISVTVKSDRTGAPSFSKTTTRVFDGQGNVQTEVEFAGDPKAITTNTEYYANTGLPRSVTTSATKVKTKLDIFEYDANFRHLTKTTNSLKQVASVSYDARWSKPTSITGINGLTTEYRYDNLGREVEMIPPLGYTVKTSYTWAGKGLYNILVEHPYKPDTREHFDIFERSFYKEMEHFKNSWLSSSQVFDNKGRIESKTSPSAITTNYTYYDDVAERLKTTNNGIGDIIYKYTDNNGETKVEVTTPANRKYSSTTDATGKLIQKKDDGGTLDYTYDGQGNQTKVKLDGKVTVSTSYDGVGDKTALFDVNAGTTTYKFDAFGQLIYQETPTQAKNSFVGTTYEYTVLGQVEKRIGAEGTTTYEYIKSGAAANNIETVTGFNGYSQISAYDGLGRIDTYTEVTDGIPFSHTYAYDSNNGNPTKETYPTGFFVERTFDQNSFLEKVVSDKGVVIFDGQKMDAYGNYTNYDLGNGLSTSNNFDQYGFPISYTTSGALDLHFHFDQKTGNLDYRTDKVKGLYEEFKYDDLDRLISIIGPGKPINIDYSANGNVRNKSDIGTFDYHPKKVNAVRQIDRPKAFLNQENSPVTQPISYTPFDQPDEITEGDYDVTLATSRHYNFTYGPDYQRRMMEYRRGIEPSIGVEPDPNTGYNHNQIVEERRYYVGNYEEFRVAPSAKFPEGQISQIHYIEGGDGICAILLRIGELDSMFYVHKDYLGSFLTFTGEKGGIVYEQNFDAWGNYRNITDWSYVKKNHIPQWLNRGYTGHEHLIRFGPHTPNWVANSPDNTLFMPFNIINMNGRIYDPMIGRMMSPDNYVHDGMGTQGYNRYSYANNNPLKFTDPDGNFWHIVIGAAIGGIANLGIKAWQGKIENFGDGVTAFGIGALAGGVIAATGGAAAVAASGTGAGSVAATAYAAAGGTGSIFLNSAAVGAASTGFVGGAIAGAAGTAGGSWIQGLGNQHFFQDPYSLKQYGRDIIIGGVTGGVFGQVAKWLKKGSTPSSSNVIEEGRRRPPPHTERGVSITPEEPEFIGADGYDLLGNEFFNPNFGTRDQSSRWVHIFDQAAEHNLDGLVSKFGTETNAFNAVDAAAQQALSNGQLTPNINGILPGISKGGSLLNVGGLNVWLNGGRIVNGRVIISSFTMRGF